MAPCVDPKSEAIAGLSNKVFRSLGLDVEGLPDSEKTKRDNCRAKIRSEFIPFSEATKLAGMIPGLGPPTEEQMKWAIPISLPGLSIIANKIARGCEYKYDKRKRLVEHPYGIRAFLKESDVMPNPDASASSVIDFGPGCKVRRLSLPEDPKTVWYWISIWNAIRLFVRIELKTQLAQSERFWAAGRTIPEDHNRMTASPYLRNINS